MAVGEFFGAGGGCGGAEGRLAGAEGEAEFAVDLGEQGIKIVRLAQDGVTGGVGLSFEVRRVGAAGQEHRFHVGLASDELAGQFEAAHAWQGDLRQEEVDRGGVFADECDRPPAVGGLQHRVLTAAKGDGDEGAKDLLVVNQQDRGHKLLPGRRIMIPDRWEAGVWGYGEAWARRGWATLK